MGLSSAFNIGRSALNASQLAIQVAGNNMANAATPGYSRQVATLTPLRGDATLGVGRGVGISGIRRSIDEALQARLWSGIADQAAADERASIYSSVETSLNELTGYDLSSELAGFFSTWSERANLTQSSTLVVQQGVKLAEFMGGLRSDLVKLRQRVDAQLGARVERADVLLGQVADLNAAVTSAEVGSARANSLRDQRDTVIGELSELLDVTVVEQSNGAVDVLVGSTPIVLAGQSRGLELQRKTVDGELRVFVSIKANGERLDVPSGRIGALLDNRESAVNETISDLDDIAAQLIFQVNRLHSTGTNETGLTSALGSLTMTSDDRTRALNDPENKTLAGLPFSPSNGGFFVHVTQPGGSMTETVRIDVDLDGLTDAGEPGFDDDTSAEDIRAALDAIDGLTATFTSDGRLSVEAAAGFSLSFSDDSSNALAVLGVNGYFTGKNASDIAVRQELVGDESLLMTGRLVDGTYEANGTALAIAGLHDQAVPELGGQTIRGRWLSSVQSVAMRTNSADTRAQATTLVRESLEAQRANLSGVSIDEETLDLMSFQRQYEGAARFLSVVDQMTQTLLQLI